jgi:hypothetical protein
LARLFRPGHGERTEPGICDAGIYAGKAEALASKVARAA